MNPTTAHSNSSITTTTLSWQQQSLNALTQAYYPTVFWVVMSVPGALINICEIVTVAISAPLRENNCYLCLLHLALAQLILNLSMMVIASLRLFKLATGIGEVTAPIGCLGSAYLFDFGQTAIAWQTIAMTLDRLMRISFPLYRYVDVKRLQIINVIGWIIPAASIAAFDAVGLSPSLLLTYCNYNLSIQASAIATKQIFDIILIVISICGYLAIIPILYFRLKTGGREGAKRGESLSQVRANMQVQATKSALMVAAFYSFTWLAQRIFGIVTTTYLPQIKASVSPFANLAFPINSYGMFALTMWKNEEFRTELLGKLRNVRHKVFGTPMVAPTTTAATTTAGRRRQKSTLGATSTV